MGISGRSADHEDGAAIVSEAEACARAEILPRYRKGEPKADFTTRIRSCPIPGLKRRSAHRRRPALACALSGENDIHAVSYGTEAGLFQAAGIPAVVCGPGSIEVAHRADEYVALDQLDACAAFLRRVAPAAGKRRPGLFSVPRYRLVHARSSENQQPKLGERQGRRRCRFLQAAGKPAGAGISLDRLLRQPRTG